MKVRGRRECQACGTVWSYYDTGSPACPDCGSFHSVGLDERTRHTDAPVDFDLTPVRNAIDVLPREELAEQAASTALEYVRRRGFIDAGELALLDHTYVAATELLDVSRAYGRTVRPSDEAELFFVDLLNTADDDRARAPESVPPAFRSAYGLAMASATGDYQAAVRTVLSDEPDPDASALAGRIRDHRKRIEALDGDVDPADARRLVRSARDLGKYVRGEEAALVTADNWLAGIEAEN